MVMRRNDTYERQFVVTEQYSAVYWVDKSNGNVLFFGAPVGDGKTTEIRKMTENISIIHGGNTDDRYMTVATLYRSGGVSEWCNAVGSGSGVPGIKAAIDAGWDALMQKSNSVSDMKPTQNGKSMVFNLASGEIVINREDGTWVWKNHYSPYDCTQVYVNADTTPGTKTPGKDTEGPKYCFGQYHCKCEDINVLCSCEDEEAGCSPAVACPDGKKCKSQVADNIGGGKVTQRKSVNADDQWGGTKPVLNPDGWEVPSGGIGGVTGTGSEDYANEHTTTSSTLTN